MELIDTCWDVNLIDDMLKCRQNIELIDTCWDVNDCRHQTYDYQRMN